MKRDPKINYRLRAVMHLNGKTQREVAEICGMRYGSLHRAVNGERPIYADELVSLALAVDVHPGVLLGIDVPDPFEEWSR